MGHARAKLALAWCGCCPSNPTQTLTSTPHLIAHHVTSLQPSPEHSKTTRRIYYTAMTTFEPSLSTTMRASSHDAPSMADQLPSINFGFDDLRSRMNQFTARFDAFIETGRRRVLEERNQFRMNVAELHGTLSSLSVLSRRLSNKIYRGPTHEETRHRNSRT